MEMPSTRSRGGAAGAAAVSDGNFLAVQPVDEISADPQLTNTNIDRIAKLILFHYNMMRRSEKKCKILTNMRILNTNRMKLKSEY